MDLISSLEWVSGRHQTTSAAIDGSSLTWNRVPQRKVIGRMTTLLNRFSVALDLARRPAVTPSIANIRHDRMRHSSNGIVITISEVSTRPSARRTSPPSSPRTRPMMDLPRTMDDVCMGQSTISSKLVWNSLCIIIFWAVVVNPAVMVDMAAIPGMAYAT